VRPPDVATPETRHRPADAATLARGAQRLVNDGLTVLDVAEAWRVPVQQVAGWLKDLPQESSP